MRGTYVSRGEEEVLKRLLDDDTIVIRPADKGSGIVVMNSEDYWDRLQEEVRYSSTYRQTGGEQTKAVSKKVKALADRLRKINNIQLPTDQTCPLLLFCVDVNKLYLSVPKQEGLAACRKGRRSLIPDKTHVFLPLRTWIWLNFVSCDLMLPWKIRTLGQFEWPDLTSPFCNFESASEPE